MDDRSKASSGQLCRGKSGVRGYRANEFMKEETEYLEEDKTIGLHANVV